jgi:hypothetical protein
MRFEKLEDAMRWALQNPYRAVVHDTEHYGVQAFNWNPRAEVFEFSQGRDWFGCGAKSFRTPDEDEKKEPEQAVPPLTGLMLDATDRFCERAGLAGSRREEFIDYTRHVLHEVARMIRESQRPALGEMSAELQDAIHETGNEEIGSNGAKFAAAFRTYHEGLTNIFREAK